MTKPKRMTHFFTKVVGVAHANPDGSSRQAAIARCRVGDPLVLDHEPDNPHDPCAMRVVTRRGEQLGHLRAELAEEVVGMADRDYRWGAFVASLTGGTEDAPTRGVNLVLVRAAPGVPVEEAKTYFDTEVAPLLAQRGAGRPKGCAGAVLLAALAILALSGWAFLAH